MKIEDLVILKYAPNTCYVNVVETSEIDNQDINIGLENKTWDYLPSENYELWQNILIGRARNIRGKYGEKKVGIIGIYNKNSIKDLNQMAMDATEFTKPKSICKID